MKIISLNTWKCDGEYKARLALMGAGLKNLNPDLVALQECFRSEEGNADTLQYLSSFLGMEYAFLPGRSKKRFFNNAWVDSESGLGILSRFPIQNLHSFDLPCILEDPDRKVQMARILASDGLEMLFVNTHLTHLSKAPGLRKSQTEMLSHVVRVENRPHSFALVCGDFNARIESEEMQYFLQHTKALDMYQSGNGAEPRNSLVEAYLAGKHYGIDHIFYVPGAEFPIPVSFKNAKMVLNQADPDSGIYPSDHFGVYSELYLGIQA